MLDVYFGISELPYGARCFKVTEKGEELSFSQKQKMVSSKFITHNFGLAWRTVRWRAFKMF